MAITVPTPPNKGLEIVRGTLRHLLATSSNTHRSLAQADFNNLTVAAPHPVYVVGLENIIEREIVSAAMLTSWRYILFDGDQTLLATEISLDQDGEAIDLLSANQGPFVEGTIKGVGFAESQEIIQEGSYELRLLDIPALYFLGLWLSNENSLFIPLSPAPGEVKAYFIYTENELVSSLLPIAKQRLMSNENVI